MELIAIPVILAVVVGITVVPVMLAARFVGAGRAGFGPALLAVILQSVLSLVTRELAASPGIALIVAVVIGSLIYAGVLDTTFLRGLLIGIISTIISVLVIFVVGGFFAGSTNSF